MLPMPIRMIPPGVMPSISAWRFDVGYVDANSHSNASIPLQIPEPISYSSRKCLRASVDSANAGVSHGRSNRVDDHRQTSEEAALSIF
jgi:hypothetical protein